MVSLEVTVKAGSILVALACGGVLRPDPLPTVRPAAPYLCAVNSGGAGWIIVYTNVSGARLMTVDGPAAVCKSLPQLQEVYLGFEPTMGLQNQRIYWTPIPLRPLEDVPCWFVDVSNPVIAIGAIRPCIER